MHIIMLVLDCDQSRHILGRGVGLGRGGRTLGLTPGGRAVGLVPSGLVIFRPPLGLVIFLPPSPVLFPSAKSVHLITPYGIT